MINTNAKSLVSYSMNLGIRGITIGFKFLFALFLGRYFSDGILGGYGLFSTTVSFSFIALSLSFESYALREIIQRPKEDQLSYVRNLFLFFTISFLAFAPFSFFFSSQGWISAKLIYYFLVILFLETLCQVFFSLFTILQKSIAANLVLFFSQGSWIMVVFLMWIVNPESFISIEDFLNVWIVGSVIACGYGFLIVKKMYINSHVEPIDWKWIKAGLSVSMFFFCSALGYKVIEFIDRYFIEFTLGTSKLGVYVFYSQIANLMNTVINVTVILMLYPKLIDSYVKNDIDTFFSIKRKMTQRIIIIGLVLSIFATLFLKIALVYIGKESFYQEISVFYILLLANLAMNLSFIPHYCMYAMRRDAALLYTTIVGSVASITLNFFLIRLYGIKGAALATCMSFILVWILKSLYITKKRIYAIK